MEQVSRWRIWRILPTTRATLALVFASSGAGTLGMGALTLAGALLPLAVAVAGKGIIDAVVAGSTLRATRWVMIELALVTAMAAVSQGGSLVRTLVSSRLSLDINLRILRKALTLELPHFEDADFYDKLTKARREASSRPLSVVSRSFQIIQAVIGFVGYTGLLVRFSGFAVLALVIAAVPATVAEVRFSQQGFRLRGWRSPETRRLMYLEYVLSNDSHAKEVKLFGLGPMLLGRYRDIGEQFVKEERGLSLRRAGWGYALSLLATAAFYGFYARTAMAAANGALSIGEMTLYMVAFRQGQQTFQSFLSAFGGMYEDHLYMTNLFGFLELPTEVQPAPPTPSPPLDERGIRFDKVTFRYPGKEKPALEEVDLFIPQGTSLALVGQNGAGKTTFIKLLTRLYTPTGGRILIDGKDLRDWDAEELRRRIAVIFQDFNQYQLTVRENVGVGSVEHMEEDPQIDRAVDRGGAQEVVQGLARGIETPLGRWFKEGAELSGGQWQKLALARAFMREEADILVLDEPTAALDAEAEHAVFQRFRELTRGRSSILISHRFPTVRMADRIVVVDGGRIAEEGSHDELLARGGRYARLFQLQAQGYL